MGKLKIAFPYLLFLAMAALVVWSNTRGATSTVDSTAERTTNKDLDPNRCPICSMDASGEDAVRAEIDGKMQGFCWEGCRDRFLEQLGKKERNPESERLIDPVCKMDVNAAWGISHNHGGKTYYFCTQQCRESFAQNPDEYTGDKCLVCQKPVTSEEGFPATYLGKAYTLCSASHREEFKSDPAGFFMHRMWGIPDWLYYLSIGLVLLISFLMFEGTAAFRRTVGSAERGDVDGLPRVAHATVHARNAGFVSIALPIPGVSPSSDRIDLMRWGWFRTLILSRPFRFSVQLFMVAAFLTIIAAGLFGNQNPALNVAPLLTWTIWWCGLVVLILFAGKAWCYMCPWDALAGWMEKLRFWTKTDEGCGLGLHWPKVIRNVFLATLLFVGLTWVELGFGVTMSPRATAYLAIAMLAMAIVSAFLFDRKSFCRYGCLVGRVSGLYALFAGIEVRRRDADVCNDCHSKDCIRGTESAYGCPTFEYPGGMDSNTYCIQCAECLQACPSDNLAVNLRPWGADLAALKKPRTDEAYLALLMLSISGFHGLTMTPVWGEITGALESRLSIDRIASFTAGMAALMGFPILIYAALVAVSLVIVRRADPLGSRQTSYRDYFIRYAYCVLPIALFYHLAHNLEHLLMEGPKVLALLSDPFGWGWNVLGTAGWTVPPLVSLDVLWILQVLLVGIGHVYSLWSAQRISRGLFTSEVAASRGQWPMLVGMIAFSVFSLWLLKQPMEMRTSAM